MHYLHQVLKHRAEEIGLVPKLADPRIHRTPSKRIAAAGSLAAARHAGDLH